MPLRRSTRPLGLAALAVMAAATLPQTAQAAWPPTWGSGTVKSVDGPDRLTLSRKGRDIPVRLFLVDVPKAGECGAEETSAALRGFVDRAPRRVRYEIARPDGGPQLRDVDGRYFATVSYQTRRYLERDFSNDLARAEWGRPGAPASIEARPTPNSVTVDSDYQAQSGLGVREPRPRRGLWAKCGGRTHLPNGEPVPLTAPTTWSVDGNGVTSAVGPLTLSPELTPSSSMTLRQLSGVAPTEVTRFYDGCRAWLPSLQVRAYAYVAEGAPCGDAVVSAVSTTGPEGAGLAQGAAVGRPVAEFRALFPLLTPDPSSGIWSLAGPDHRPWAWTTDVQLRADRKTVGSMVTYASPSR